MVILRALIVATLMALTFLVSPVSSAAPITDCAATVVDETTDQLFDMERLTEAVNDMRNRTGLDVYVRTFQETPHGDAGCGGAKHTRRALSGCSLTV